MNGPQLEWESPALDASLWQGIVRIESRSLAAWAGVELTVHLARPINGIRAEDVAIVGGRSITNLPYQVTVQQGESTLTVSFSDKGDHSEYRVLLRSGGADQLHPFFAQAPFRFFIDCEAGDCRVPILRARAIASAQPAVDIRDKDYLGYMQLLTDWVRIHNPSWTDLSAASTERMLLELLAYHADLLSYYQDRVANEAYLDTARERHSLRQHATLLGYDIFDGQAATTTLALDVTHPGLLPPRTEVRNRGSSDQTLRVFHTAQRTRLEPNRNSNHLKLAAWPGAASARLPAKASSVMLWEQVIDLRPGMRIAFSQGTNSEIVTLQSVERLMLPGWSSSPDMPETTALQPLTRLTWHPPLIHDYLPWSQPVFRIHANLVDAVQGQWRSASIGFSDIGDTTIFATSLHHRNSVVVPLRRSDGNVVPQLRAWQLPEGPVIMLDGQALLEVEVDGQIWSGTEHLHNSQAYDLHYVATADTDGRIWLHFGDGVHGREIRVDSSGRSTIPTVVAHYCIGNMAEGNCPIGHLTELVPARSGSSQATIVQQLGIRSIENIVPAAGSLPAQSNDAVRIAIPAALRSGPLQRAVSIQDYAAAARAVPGVARAAAKLHGGIFNTVIILVDPIGQVGLTEVLQQAVHAKIDQLRMAGREHRVMAPIYVPLEVELALCIQPGFQGQSVRDRVLAELRAGTNEQPGYFHPDRLNFGEPIELGNLLAYVQQISGVRSVKAFAFRRQSDLSVNRVVTRIALSQTEIGRLDADDDFPENGTLRIRVVGLDLPDESDYAIASATTMGGLS